MQTKVPRSWPRRPVASTSAARRARKAASARPRASGASRAASASSSLLCSLSPAVTESSEGGEDGVSCQPTWQVIPPPLSIPTGRGVPAGSVASATCCTAASSALASSSPLSRRKVALGGSSSRSNSSNAASMAGVTVPSASAWRSPPVAPTTVVSHPVNSLSVLMLSTHSRRAAPPSMSTSTILRCLQ